ncbi:hypothetical protein KDK77_03740 [bacterium]|nr:hypothetical protein [bacterium]
MQKRCVYFFSILLLGASVAYCVTEESYLTPENSRHEMDENQMYEYGFTPEKRKSVPNRFDNLSLPDSAKIKHQQFVPDKRINSTENQLERER